MKEVVNKSSVENLNKLLGGDKYMVYRKYLFRHILTPFFFFILSAFFFILYCKSRDIHLLVYVAGFGVTLYIYIKSYMYRHGNSIFNIIFNKKIKKDRWNSYAFSEKVEIIFNEYDTEIVKNEIQIGDFYNDTFKICDKLESEKRYEDLEVFIRVVTEKLSRRDINNLCVYSESIVKYMVKLYKKLIEVEDDGNVLKCRDWIKNMILKICRQSATAAPSLQTRFKIVHQLSTVLHQEAPKNNEKKSEFAKWVADLIVEISFKNTEDSDLNSASSEYPVNLLIDENFGKGKESQGAQELIFDAWMRKTVSLYKKYPEMVKRIPSILEIIFQEDVEIYYFSEWLQYEISLTCSLGQYVFYKNHSLVTHPDYIDHNNKNKKVDYFTENLIYSYVLSTEKEGYDFNEYLKNMEGNIESLENKKATEFNLGSEKNIEDDLKITEVIKNLKAVRQKLEAFIVTKKASEAITPLKD